MPEPKSKVTQLETPRTVSATGGNGNGFETRLRALEVQVVRIDERVANMQENMAKKNDVTGLKVWILGGVLSAVGVAAAISAAVVKVFF